MKSFAFFDWRRNASKLCAKTRERPACAINICDSLYPVLLGECGLASGELPPSNQII